MNLEINDIKPESIPSDHKKALKGEEDLKSHADNKAHGRNQQLKDVAHWVVICSLILLGGLISFCMAVRIAHLFIPVSWIWLTGSQIITIDHLVKYASTGALGIVVTNYLGKNMFDGSVSK